MKLGTSAFIGIVTVLYNSDVVLPDFFDSLAAQKGFEFRLFVIDNGRTDSGTHLSRDLAKAHGIDATCVFNNNNVGVAKGNNQGIALAITDGCSHILLANNDTVFDGSTIHRLLIGLRENSGCAATPKIMYHDDPTSIWYAGGHINRWTIKSPHYGERQLDNGQFDQQREVGYAPTCFMLLETRVFNAVGLMDEQYFVYGDDTDFVWRMNTLGMKILYMPTAVVFHKVSTSTGGSKTPFSVYYTNRNRIYLLRKNLRGIRRVIAMLYVLATRAVRLSTLPPEIARVGWKGVLDGFRIPVVHTRLPSSSND